MAVHYAVVLVATRFGFDDADRNRQRKDKDERGDDMDYYPFDASPNLRHDIFSIGLLT